MPTLNPSVNEWEDALDAPDGNPLHRRLAEIALELDQKEIAAPHKDSAIRYLHAFTDKTLPVRRRRWVGVVFLSMLRSSSASMKTLQMAPQDLHTLGDVVIRDKEQEELRIVAGLIVRQMMQEGAPFSSFWRTSKVPDSAPYFPIELSQSWMEEYQEYLDYLVKLAVLPQNPSMSDPEIVYSVAINVPEEFYFVNSKLTAMVLTVDRGCLTMIMFNNLDTAPFIHVIDIPASNILEWRMNKAVLDNSQDLHVDHEPWELVLSFIKGQWTYLRNGSECKGTRMKIVFKNFENAKQANRCIAEVTGKGLPARSSTQYAKMSSSQALDVSRHDLSSSDHSAHDELAREERITTSNYTTTKNSNQNQPTVSDSSMSLSSLSKGTQSQGAKNKFSSANQTGRLRKPASKVKEEKPSSEKDEFDVPASPPSARFSLPSTTEQSPPKKMQQNSATKAELSRKTKLNGQRPKPKMKGKAATQRIQRSESKEESRRTGVSDVSGDELGQNFQDHYRESGVAKKKTVNGPEAKPEQRKRPQGTSKSLQLAKRSKSKDRKLDTPNEDKLDKDVYDVPSDDEPKTKKLPRRSAAKQVDYNEEESDHAETGSDYAEVEVKKVKIPSTISKPPQHKPRSSLKIESAKVLKRNSRKKGNEDTIAKSMSPHRHSVISNLLSHSTPAQNKHCDTTREKEKQTKSIRYSGTQSTFKNSTASDPMVISSDADISDDNIVDSGDGEAALEGMETGNYRNVSSPLAKKSVNNSFASQRDLLDNANTSKLKIIDQQPTVHIPAATSPFTNKRKADSAALSTPNLKRPKLDEMSAQVGLGAGNNHSGAPTRQSTTFAPTRILNDPVSPCPLEKAAYLKERQHLAKQSTMYNPISNAESTIENKDSEIEQAVRSEHGPALEPIRTMPTIRQTPSTKDAENPTPRAMVEKYPEILSSNSKPVPASPHAESTAISGYVPGKLVEQEKQIADWKTARNDPFNKKRKQEKKIPSAFVRRCTEDSDEMVDLVQHNSVAQKQSQPRSQASFQPIEIKKKPAKANRSNVSIVKQLSSTKTSKPVNVNTQKGRYAKLDGNHSAIHGDVDMDGEETLVGQEEFLAAPGKISPVHWPSSPPRSHGSSHSSTSAEHDQGSEMSSPDQQSEEMEWEAALQPHQFPIADRLMRVTKGVLRHIVDNETAVKDIADTYVKDGEHLIEKLHTRHQEDIETLFSGIDQQKDARRQEFEDWARKIAKDREQFTVSSHHGPK